MTERRLSRCGTHFPVTWTSLFRAVHAAEPQCGVYGMSPKKVLSRLSDESPVYCRFSFADLFCLDFLLPVLYNHAKPQVCPALCLWYSHRESNPDQRFRKPPFYPFNYGSRFSGCKVTIFSENNIKITQTFFHKIFFYVKELNLCIPVASKRPL